MSDIEQVVVEHTHNDDGTSSVSISGGPEGFGCLITSLLASMIADDALVLIVDGETVEGLDETEFEAA